MDHSPALAPRSVQSASWLLPDVAHLGLHELTNRSPLRIQVLPSGALFAIRHRDTLINQVLPAPADTGLFRLLVRWHLDENVAGWASLVDAGTRFVSTKARAEWTAALSDSLSCTAALELHSTATAWTWRVSVHNHASTPQKVDLILAQDLGLADEGAVRNNEAYTSHYVDLLPIEDAAWGWTILARQNLPMAEERHPWLGVACLNRASAFCTDGFQFFGADYRLTGEPIAARVRQLASRRVQYECACACLQSELREIDPGESAETVFIARFFEDHPAPSGSEDLDRLRETVSTLPNAHRASRPAAASTANRIAPSLFHRDSKLHGDAPSPADWEAWFPGERRHVEHDHVGSVLSFFHDIHTHVVSRDKEANVARPHGHILRSGSPSWIDEQQWGLTCFANGIFAAQAYLGNPSFARLLPVVRNALHVGRGRGQRVFVRDEDTWRQLGVPSAFAMQPGEVRWIYRFGDDVIEARVWCSPALAASYLELRVIAGSPREFLVSHDVVLGVHEFEHRGEISVFADEGWASCRPAPASVVGTRQPDVCFAIAAAEPASVAEFGGDELIHADARRRDGPYVVLRFNSVAQCGVILLGSPDGPTGLATTLTATRAEFLGEARVAQPSPVPLRVRHPGDVGVARLHDVLPWFHHNAAIHFSAPHGLEQTGGAAWGVRDVCQGSLEWLLATGQLAVARRMLAVVFAQQYVDGAWPQWFMHPPYAKIQQAHSHGDVCFWPVKALCDYVEASNDFEFLGSSIGYTDAEDFTRTGPDESLLAHADRVISHAEQRFIAGTALVNYGDGDWDDTLQPADPAMRTHMISAWTVALAFQTFRQLAELCTRAGEQQRATRLSDLLERMRHDFHAHLMPGGTVAGFLVHEGGGFRPLLHPADHVTGIRYRLLPMTRAILAGLLTPGEAKHHVEIIEQHLQFADGVRLMSEPARYHGGSERLFKRADTAANVGREIGLQYVHAHLRYAEAMARIGDAEALWRALQIVNPVGLTELLPQAAPRQSNVYFSSSDADFADRYDAVARWDDLRAGRVPVRAGWRLYSSGPGLFLHKIRSCLLGLRESFDHVVFDPVLPESLDGLVAELEWRGYPLRVQFRITRNGAPPTYILVNDRAVDCSEREANSYRIGGSRIAAAQFRSLLRPEANRVMIEC